VKYFRDRFSQKPDVWLPQNMTPAEKRDGLIAAFGNLFAENLTASVRLFSVGASSAKVTGGCIGDLADTRICR
jgi:hypothetical protein